MQLSFDPGDVRIGQVADIVPAAHALARFAERSARLRVAPWANIASTQPMTDADGNILASTIFGWPEVADCWWRDRSLALRSPLTQLSRLENEAVWASARGVFRVDSPVPTPPGVDLSMMDGRRVVRAAIIVPVHLPFGQVGVVTYTCMDDARDDLGTELRDYGIALQMLSMIFVGSYARTMAARSIAEDGVVLSAREAECLRWASIGKTDYEIAELISRTHGTVRYHLHNSSMKLRTVTRAQTVSKAARLGYL